jgi:hypothetical protein
VTGCSSGGRTEGEPSTLVVTYMYDQRVIRFITGWDSTDGEQARYLK